MDTRTFQIAEGVRCTEVIDPRQRTCLLELHFLCPHTPARAPYHAMLGELLTVSCAAHPDPTEVSRILDHLYAAELCGEVSKIGNAADLCFSVCWLDDRFTPDRETVTAQVTGLLTACLTAPNLTETAQGLGFSTACFEAARKNLLRAIANSHADPVTDTVNCAAELTFPDAPAALSAFGAKKDTQSADPCTACQLWQEICRTAPVEIIAVLPEESSLVPGTLREIFGKIAPVRTPVPPQVFTAPEEPAHPFHRRKQRAFPQSCLVQTYGFRGEQPHADSRYLLAEVLGGESESLLFLNLREKEGLCYSCDASYSRSTGTLWVVTSAEPGNIPRAEEGIAAQIQKLKDGDFPESILHSAKMSLAYGLAEDADSAEGLAEQVFLSLLYGDCRSFQQCRDDLLAVTAGEIKAAANSLYLHTSFITEPKTNS